MSIDSVTKIFIDDKEINYKDWTLFKKDEKWMICINYPSNKKYSCLLEKCRIEPTIKREEDILFDTEKKVYSKVSSVLEVGRKYLIITYPSNDTEYLLKRENYELKKGTEITETSVFEYFYRVAREREAHSQKEDDKSIASSVVSQFEQIIPCDELAMNALFSGKAETRGERLNMIYPFGVNETQLGAIRSAFKSQVSIIEGPPGTGKTQTILNIIANIIINGKTCAIVSNNNSAVENVYQRLEEVQLDFLIAKLGRREKREKFFENMSYTKPNVNFQKISIEEISELLNKIETKLAKKNRLEQLKNQIREIEIEKNYLEVWSKEHPEIDVRYIEKYKLDSKRSVELFTYIRLIEDRRLTLMNKWDLLIHYRIFKSRFLNNIKDRESFVFSLQYTYYEKLLEEKLREKEIYDRELRDANFDILLKELRDKSMDYLYQYVNCHMPQDAPNITIENYKKNFSKFASYFPVIGSSTYALIKSLGIGTLLDYVIIDEASQQDLVPGVLCFGCAKNVIVVGDSKQLPHIPTHSDIPAPNEFYDCTKYSLLDSIRKIFKDSIPDTMLREHYRCQSKIIQFCNQQFYDNQLICMTKDCGGEAMSLIVTALGDHMRDYKNQREIESVISANEEYGYVAKDENDHQEYGYVAKDENDHPPTIGFIAPYNNQVNLAGEMLPERFSEATIHKFQGRACDEIIFSTVLDKKEISQRQIEFVDNAALVNVAVSRAKNKFTLVTGKDVFKKNNKYIAALIRYIEYYGDDVVESPVISAFDLLYKEYDKSLEKLAEKLNPKDSKYKSEQICSALLKDVLKIEQFHMYTFHTQVYLKQLVKNDSELYSEREQSYINNRASCDFVIYYDVGKAPCGVIEVDGGKHDMPKQKERDLLKNSILEKNEIPLLRLKTTDSEIRNKIIGFLGGLSE